MADKPVRTVREVLGDLHALRGSDAAVWVMRNLIETKVSLGGSAYLAVLPLSITPNTTMTSGNSGPSAALSVDAE